MMTIIQNFGWIDLLDIAFVAIILYGVILLIRETMAIRLLAGIAVVFLLYLAAQLAGFKALYLLLDNLIVYLVLILVMIFHGDLRRALLTLGKFRLMPALKGEEESEVIDELVTAAESLASKKIGALIVIERDMNVNNFLELGTEIDAKVTSELITSIFLPYSPIHDGAVLIQNGKLTRAGCFLPLTQNPDVSMALGTRHRAAIGLTELVDSVVVVISEETGKVSVVFGGRMTRDLDPQTLRKVLKRLLAMAVSRWRT